MVLNKLVEKVGENTMKKLIVILVSLALMLSMISTVAFGSTVEIEHSVESQSEFQVNGRNISEFKGTTSVEVAEVSIINNTRDGYRVTIQATNGVLDPIATADGETPIPYQLSSTKSGISPSGGEGTGFQALTIATAPSQTETLILGNDADAALSGNDLLNSPTDLEFSVKVKITDTTFLQMAGHYSETLTLRYYDM